MNSRMMNAVVKTYSLSLCCSRPHFETKRIFISDHNAEHEHRHEAAGLQPVGSEIGADYGHKSNHRRVFGKKGPALVSDQ